MTESTQTPVDAMASDLGTAVARRTLAEVELQIAEAETATMARPDMERVEGVPRA